MAKRVERETELYGPVKTLLEGQGYEVKGEVGAADVVACRTSDNGEEEDPVIVELKTGFTLTLFQQAVERKKITDLVYIAVPRLTGATWRKGFKGNLRLCRYLGLGLITVRTKDGFCEVHADPGPYAPRKMKRGKAILLREFSRRSGDPTKGGSTRSGLITAYRQDALKCVKYLREFGPTKGAIVAKATGAQTATRLMADNHYGWFEKVETGIYGLAEKVDEKVEPFTEQLETLELNPVPKDH